MRILPDAVRGDPGFGVVVVAGAAGVLVCGGSLQAPNRKAAVASARRD
jgi:hypothetical protein